MSPLPVVLAGVAQASSSKSYHYEFMEILRETSAVQSKRPLAHLIETDLIKRIGGRNVQHLSGLVSACQESERAGSLAALCTSAAEKIWETNDEMILLAMVSSVMAMSQTTPPPHWQERNRLIAAARGLLREALHVGDANAEARRIDAAMRCQPLEPGLHQKIWREPEWRLLKQSVLQKQSKAVSPLPEQGRSPSPTQL